MLKSNGYSYFLQIFIVFSILQMWCFPMLPYSLGDLNKPLKLHSQKTLIVWSKQTGVCTKTSLNYIVLRLFGKN